MVNSSFEYALFEAVPLNNVDQAQQTADNLNKSADEATKKFSQSNKETKSISTLSQTLGLKDGQTLAPKDIVAKIKQDPSILDNIAKDENLLKLTGFDANTVQSLKSAPMIATQNSQNGQAEQTQSEQPQNNGTQPEAKTATDSNDTQSSENTQGQAQNVINNPNVVAAISATLNSAKRNKISAEDLIAYIKQNYK